MTEMRHMDAATLRNSALYGECNLVTDSCESNVIAAKSPICGTHRLSYNEYNVSVTVLCKA